MQGPVHFTSEPVSDAKCIIQLTNPTPFTFYKSYRNFFFFTDKISIRLYLKYRYSKFTFIL